LKKSQGLKLVGALTAATVLIAFAFTVPCIPFTETYEYQVKEWVETKRVVHKTSGVTLKPLDPEALKPKFVIVIIGGKEFLIPIFADFSTLFTCVHNTESFQLCANTKVSIDAWSTGNVTAILYRGVFRGNYKEVERVGPAVGLRMINETDWYFINFFNTDKRDVTVGATVLEVAEYRDVTKIEQRTVHVTVIQYLLRILRG